jgi:CDP-glycerol glycerophosphotransferase (TagB/SpsB family)
MWQPLQYLTAAVTRLYLLPLYLLSGLAQRRTDLWVFGSWGGQRFADNSAAFFLYCNKHLNDGTECVWISHRRSIVREVRAMGFAAHWWWSPAGMISCLRAGVHVFDCFPKDANFWLSRGAKLVNLWSGVPLKSFERDIDNRSSRYFRLFHGTWYERLVLSALMPWHVVRPHLVIAISDETATVIARAFDVPRDKVAVTGLPRNDEMLKPEATASPPDEIQKLHQPGRHLIFYLPTFRDSGRDFANFDWHLLDDLLEEKSATLLIKFHPVDKTQLDTPARNVITLSRDVDIYKLLPHAAALISDYSSIIWDFMLLRRPLVLFVPDIKDFAESSRSLLFDPYEIEPDIVCRNFAELEDHLRKLSLEPDGDRGKAEKMQALLGRFHAYHDAASSQRVLAVIQSELKDPPEAVVQRQSSEPRP